LGGSGSGSDLEQGGGGVGRWRRDECGDTVVCEDRWKLSSRTSAGAGGRPSPGRASEQGSVRSDAGKRREAGVGGGGRGNGRVRVRV
jgi:hypothetical protein